jgi:hypothetical protein
MASIAVLWGAFHFNLILVVRASFALLYSSPLNGALRQS